MHRYLPSEKSLTANIASVQAHWPEGIKVLCFPWPSGRPRSTRFEICWKTAQKPLLWMSLYVTFPVPNNAPAVRNDDISVGHRCLMCQTFSAVQVYNTIKFGKNRAKHYSHLWAVHTDAFFTHAAPRCHYAVRISFEGICSSECLSGQLLFAGCPGAVICCL